MKPFCKESGKGIDRVWGPMVPQKMCQAYRKPSPNRQLGAREKPEIGNATREKLAFRKWNETRSSATDVL